MSRSRKKNPVTGFANCDHTTLRKAKKYMTQFIRSRLKRDKEPVNGSYFKKYWHSWHWMPSDGKQWFDPKKWPKDMRK